MGPRDPNIYPVPRFASEYGFQAFPGFEVMSNYSLPQDRNFYSDYADHIQHHGDGNAQLKSQLSTKVDIPTDEQLGTEAGFEEFLYLVDIYQARSLRVETEHYLRHTTAVDPVTGQVLNLNEFNRVGEDTFEMYLRFRYRYRLSRLQ